jgi:CRP-like cAMP-binding protein
MPTISPLAPLPPPLLETLLRSTPLDVLLFDSELVCRYAALSDDTLFGRSAEEFLGRSVDEVFPPARSDLRSALELAAHSTANYQYPAYRYTYADTEHTSETAFCWSVRVEPVTLHDYRGREEFRGVLVTLVDVLDLADDNDRLRQENDSLRRENDRLQRELTALQRRWPPTPAPPGGRRSTPHAAHGPAAGNRLLAALLPEDYRQLQPDLEQVHLSAQEVLAEPGALLTHAYFPIDCVISLLTVLADGTVAEAATIGNEGLVGLALVLGADHTPSRAICQVPGAALRMPTPAFRAALARNADLTWVLQRYIQALFNQVAQTAACNHLHRVEQRCARWLLQIQDWVRSEQFPLKQEFLALMLSVQRPTVTQVASTLRRAGAIDYRRGRVTVLNRAALEVVVCDCYRVIREQLTQATV